MPAICLPCIMCDKILDPAFPLEKETIAAQPYGATTFFSSGQYGSTVFDPIDDSMLQINVCDECLEKKYQNVGLDKGPYIPTVKWTPPPSNSSGERA